MKPGPPIKSKPLPWIFSKMLFIISGNYDVIISGNYDVVISGNCDVVISGNYDVITSAEKHQWNSKCDEMLEQIATSCSCYATPTGQGPTRWHVRIWLVCKYTEWRHNEAIFRLYISMLISSFYSENAVTSRRLNVPTAQSWTDTLWYSIHRLSHVI